MSRGEEKTTTCVMSALACSTTMQENCQNQENTNSDVYSMSQQTCPENPGFLRMNRSWTEHEELEFQDFIGTDVELESNSAWRTCTKYPGHGNFIPIYEFGAHHLPECYQQDVYMDYIKCCADLTTRLCMTKGLFDRMCSTGTAFVYGVQYYEGSCFSCKDCQTQKHRKQRCWRISLSSANHCLSNEWDSEIVKVDFFYNDKESFRSKRMKRLKGLKQPFALQNSDICFLVCETHDEELSDLLQSKHQQRLDAMAQIKAYQSSLDTTTLTNCMVAIGHPHGSTKHVTVGEEIKNYDTKGALEEMMFKGLGHDRVFYDYTTETCKGNSGCPVLRLNMIDGKCFETRPCTHLRKNVLNGLNTGCALDETGIKSFKHELFKKWRDPQVFKDFALKLFDNYRAQHFDEETAAPSDSSVNFPEDGAAGIDNTVRNGKVDPLVFKDELEKMFPTISEKVRFLPQGLDEFKTYIDDASFFDVHTQLWSFFRRMLPQIAREKSSKHNEEITAVFEPFFDILKTTDDDGKRVDVRENVSTNFKHLKKSIKHATKTAIERKTRKRAERKNDPLVKSIFKTFLTMTDRVFDSSEDEAEDEYEEGQEKENCVGGSGDSCGANCRDDGTEPKVVDGLGVPSYIVPDLD